MFVGGLHLLHSVEKTAGNMKVATERHFNARLVR